MSSKRAPRDKNSAFGRVSSPSPSAAPIATDAALFGSINAAEARNIHASATDIFSIQPDITQPRRTVPVSLRGEWDNSPQTTDKLFAAWLSAFAEETGVTLNDVHDRIFTQLRGGEIDDADAAPGVIEASLLPVVELAASIRSNGLLNPISVAMRGRQYIIEAGERRWLAYHLLHLYFGADDAGRDWSKIPARIVERPDLWRQAAENNQRSDLTAIAKARQFALLLMDLLKDEGATFEPFDAFGHEREFYAQVADAKTHRVPSGKNDQLMNAIGVDRKQLSRFRSLLTLPKEIWELGDDNALSEETVYRLSKLPPEEALAKIRKIVLKPYNFEQTTIAPTEIAADAIGTNRYFHEFNRLIRMSGKGDQEAREAVRTRIDEMRRWLDEIERQYGR